MRLEVHHFLFILKKGGKQLEIKQTIRTND